MAMLASNRTSSYPLREGLDLLLGRGLLAVGVLRDGVIVQSSPSFAKIFGIDGTPRDGLTFGTLISGADRRRVDEALRAYGAAQHGSAALALTFDAVRPDGSVFEAELVGTAGELAGGPATVVLVTDVTQRRRSEKQLSYMAFLDPLTNLPNRALLLDRLHDQLAAARLDGRVFALMVCDLDGFKKINDSLGHEGGDTLLQVVARRLEGAVRESDTVARQGGDEFAVILSRVAKREDATLVAQRMVRAFDAPIDVGGVACKVGISIGIATFPSDGVDIDALVGRADAAMYESKRAGKNRFTFAEQLADPTGDPIRLPFFRWTDAHAVGIQVIDAQHRGLVDLLNQLGEALKAARDRDAVLATLRALMNFTTRHFATEEALMAAHPGWPEEIAHGQEHRRLVDDLASLTVNGDTRSMTLTVRFLQEWLTRHIEGTDRPLGRWLRERGVA